MVAADKEFVQTVPHSAVVGKSQSLGHIRAREYVLAAREQRGDGAHRLITTFTLKFGMLNINRGGRRSKLSREKS